MSLQELETSNITEDEEVEVVVGSPVVVAGLSTPVVAETEGPTAEDDTATVVDDSCCEMKEMVNHFNVEFLREALPFLATLPDSVLNPSGVMAHLRQYTTARDALPWTTGGEGDWSGFRKSVLQYINGTHG